jgi:hypothetical protein
MLFSPRVQLNNYLVLLTLVESLSPCASRSEVLLDDSSGWFLLFGDLPACCLEFFLGDRKALSFLFREYPDVCDGS